MPRKQALATAGYTGTHDLFQAKVGDELGFREVVIKRALVERIAWANDDYNPWYMERSPWGGRLITPASLGLGYYAYPPGGSLFAKEEFEYLKPVKVGQKYRITGRLVERYARKGRDFFVAGFSVTDKNGVEVMRMRKTVAAPVTPRSK
jgi:hypothetical protein